MTHPTTRLGLATSATEKMEILRGKMSETLYKDYLLSGTLGDSTAHDYISTHRTLSNFIKLSFRSTEATKKVWTLRLQRGYYQQQECLEEGGLLPYVTGGNVTVMINYLVLKFKGFTFGSYCCTNNRDAHDTA